MIKRFLILLILLIPTYCFAGVDDSGLQTFVIDGNKMNGYINSSSQQEDFFNASKCLNIYNDGTSLSPIPSITYAKWDGANYGNITPVDLASYLSLSNKITTYFATVVNTTQQDLFFIGSGDGLVTGEINFAKILDTSTVESICSTSGKLKTFINPNIPTDVSLIDGHVYKENIIIFKAGLGLFNINFTSITDFAQKYYYDNNLFYNKYPIDAEEWNGRLFIAAENYIYYSTTSDYTDFTVGGTAGGVIKLPDNNRVLGMAKINSGIVIATKAGIWYLSGDILPSSWSLLKTINLSLSSSTAICSTANNVFIASNKKLFLIENAISLTELFEFDSANFNINDENDNFSELFNFRSISFINNKLWFTSFDGVNHCSGVYDFTSKSVYFLSFFDCVTNELCAKFLGNQLKIMKVKSNGSSSKYINLYYSNNQIMLEPCVYITKQLTLNGKQNYKKIKRIEIDCAFENAINFDSNYFYKLNYQISYNNNYYINPTYALNVTNNFSLSIYRNNNPTPITKIISNYQREYPYENSTPNDSFNYGMHTITNYETYYNQQIYPFKTYTINCLDIPAANTYKFHFESNGYMAIKQIRVYYYNYGNYKMNGR